MGEELVEVNARLADLQAKVAELEKNSQGSTPSKSLLAAQAVSQLIILGICLWAAIVSTINYAVAPSMKTSSMTPQLSTLKNAADDCPVAVHETKLVLQGGFLELSQNYTAVGSPTCQMALTIADNYENGVDHVVIPCTTCDGAKMYPLLSPLMVAEQDDHFSLRGHIGAPLNALYEIKCCYPRSECEAQPGLRCALAPVPTDGVLNQACWDPDPEPEPEPDPEPYGRMLFEADGFAELEVRHEMSPDGHADGHAELDRFECTDTPDELLAPSAETLGLPGSSCADLLAAGACELEIVKKLCAKTCNACGYKKGRRLEKCMG